MSWFQLDPRSIAARAEGSRAPSLGSSLLRGITGFTLVSVAGFLPWAMFGKWFRGHGGEIAMYATCAIVFVALSGPLLHRLIIGKGSLSRFYKVFSVAFTAYAVAWIAGWMILRGHTGSLVGLLAGAVMMGWILAAAFDAQQERWKVIAAIFVLNSAGYFIGGAIEQTLLKVCECSGGKVIAKPTQMLIAKMQWGVCYGLGFGAGLGVAFHLCQRRVRELLPGSQHGTGTL